MDQYNAAGFVCGHDFRFGYRGQGNAALLQQVCREAGIPCIVVPEQTLGGVTVSSTHIRSLMEAGEMEQAVRFLGHPHILTGKVVSGRRLGRTIGIPTANVLIPEGIVALKRGVYAGKCLVEGAIYPAVTNIGSRPTVDGHQVRAESWLLDFCRGPVRKRNYPGILQLPPSGAEIRFYGGIEGPDPKGCRKDAGILR